MAGISKATVVLALIAGMISPVAAYSYGYDEIVMMVEAEEKVFGSADYSKSLDERLQILETKVLGGPQTGSDSVRLRRVCHALGLQKPEGSVMASPFSVLIADQKGAAKPEVSNAAQTSNPIYKSETASKIERKTKNAKSAKKATKPQAAAVVTPAPSPAEPQVSQPAANTATAPATLVNAEPVQQDNAGSFLALAAVLIGIVAVCTGVVLFLQRGKNDDSTYSSFTRRGSENEYDDECESNEAEAKVDEFDPMEVLPAPTPVVLAAPIAPAAPAAPIAPVAPMLKAPVIPTILEYSAEIEELPSFDLCGGVVAQSTAPLAEAAERFNFALQPEPNTINPADTQHVADFSFEWQSAVSKNMFLEAPSAPVEYFAPAVSHVESIDKDFSNLVDAMSAEQIDELLDACCNNSDNVPPLLTFNLNVADMFGTEEEPSSVPDEAELESLASWPAFEPEVTPKISSVASWTDRHPQPTKAPAEQQTYFGSENQEWGGESYRALAQLLIDAARQVGTTRKDTAERVIPPGVPQGRRVVSAKIRHGAKGPELQDRLRTLFSERA